ncbi:MAG: hypothetical protein ACREE2_16335 [Stellaceae bacterium]
MSGSTVADKKFDFPVISAEVEIQSQGALALIPDPCCRNGDGYLICSIAWMPRQ